MKKTFLYIAGAAAFLFAIVLFVNYSNSNITKLQAEYASKKAERLESKRLADSIRIASFDSVLFKKMKSRFRIKSDEFDKDTFYINNSAPKYVNRNGIFSAIMVSNNRAMNLYLGIQYYADDWLFIQKYQFLIDGETYTFIPFDVDRDNGDGMIWEWSSIKLDAGDERFLEKLGNAKSGKVRFVGRQYDKVKQLTKQQMQDLSEGYSFFKAMGGKLN